jgi:hypothetical protein
VTASKAGVNKACGFFVDLAGLVGSNLLAGSVNVPGTTLPVIGNDGRYFFVKPEVQSQGVEG